MKFIEITLPEKKHFVLRVDAIDSIMLEEPFPGNKFPNLVIYVNSWKVPYEYSGTASQAIFDKLKKLLGVSSSVS